MISNLICSNSTRGIIAILTLFILTLAGGGPHPVARAAGQAKSQGAGAMRMYVFDCATLKDRDPAGYGLTKDQVPAIKANGKVDMADPCFLIVHPKGTLLWETGLNDATYDHPEGGGPNHDIITKSLRSQLAEVGYKPSDITYLVISHYHPDHSGNANDYAGSTWIVQKAERDFMFRENVPSTFKQDEFVKLKDSKTIVIEDEKDYDVFGDGTVTVIATPGHSPGHQSLLVKLPKTGPVLLGGDLFHFTAEYEFNPDSRVNNPENAASRAKVKAILAKTGAQLWIQHDITANAKLKKSPQYYE
jgi:N-acyl homoserine lactone hydrolase